MKNYNHNKPLEYFEIDIQELKAAGYEPIAVSYIYCEEVFVFDTNETATKALHVFNESVNQCHYGWWYGKEEFLYAVANYEREYDDTKVKIHWLKS